MESGLLLPFIQELVTKLSLLPQQWSHSSQESSAKLQSIAETGKPVFVKKVLMKITSAFLFVFLLSGSVTQARIRVKLVWDHDQVCSSRYVVQVSDQRAIRHRNRWATIASIDWLPSESNSLVVDLPDRAVNYVVSYAVCQNGQWSQPSNILKVVRHQIQASR